MIYVNDLYKGYGKELVLKNITFHVDEIIDFIAKRQVMDFIIKEVEERNMTLWITSHHLNKLENFCDSMTMIRNGQIISGEMNTLFEIFKEISWCRNCGKDPTIIFFDENCQNIGACGWKLERFISICIR